MWLFTYIFFRASFHNNPTLFLVGVPRLLVVHFSVKPYELTEMYRLFCPNNNQTALVSAGHVYHVLGEGAEFKEQYAGLAIAQSSRQFEASNVSFLTLPHLMLMFLVYVQTSLCVFFSIYSKLQSFICLISTHSDTKAYSQALSSGQ